MCEMHTLLQKHPRETRCACAVDVGSGMGPAACTDKKQGIWLPSSLVCLGLRERAPFLRDELLPACSTGKIFCVPQKTKMFAFPLVPG